MSNRAPTRLIHDPETPGAMRAALEAEIAAPVGHDLAALRTAVTTPGATAGFSGSLAAKGLALLLLTGAGVWWFFDEPSGPSAAAIAVAQPATPSPEVAPAPAPVAEAERAGPAPRAAEATTELATTPRRAVTAPAPRAPRRAPRPTPPGASKAADPGSNLAAQLALYGEGRDALHAERFDDAADAFDRYRTKYPQGSLRTEATLGELEALHRAERPARVRKVVTEALASPAFATRRAELLRVLGEAEVMAGRCQQAAAAFERAEQAGATLDAAQTKAALEACERRAMR